MSYDCIITNNHIAYRLYRQDGVNELSVETKKTGLEKLRFHSMFQLSYNLGSFFSSLYISDLLPDRKDLSYS